MTVEEFQSALKSVCLGKEYDDLPSAFKQFITAMFNAIDTDGEKEEISADSIFSFSIISGNGCIGLAEYRHDCVARQAVASVDDIDKAFRLISDLGVVTRTRYQQLFAQYLGDTDTNCQGCLLFGPLPVVK